MILSLLSSHKKGFTTLMALSMIAILLILVTGLSLSYIREVKLTRALYDETIAHMSSEGMFEYAMLKIRNHPAGFSDSVTTNDVDGSGFYLTSPRALGLQSRYTITNTATGYTKKLLPNENCILPLFVADESLLSGRSKNPLTHTGTINTTGLKILGIENLSWVIIAMSGSENIGLSGTGDILPSKIGTIRKRTHDCYDIAGNTISCLSSGVAEEVPYLYDEQMTIQTFLLGAKNPYYIITNTDSITKNLDITATSSFSLPTTVIEAQAQKNGSIQTFRFEEDTSKYYDALKYGVYNTNP